MRLYVPAPAMPALKEGLCDRMLDGCGKFQHGSSHKVLSNWSEDTLTYNTQPCNIL